VQYNWKVGDQCQALWKNSKYYLARILGVSEDRSTCKVIFDGYDSLETVRVSYHQVFERILNMTKIPPVMYDVALKVLA